MRREKPQKKKKQTKNQQQIVRTGFIVYCNIDAHMHIYYTILYLAVRRVCMEQRKKMISTHFLKQFHSLLVIIQCIKTSGIEIKIESKSSACIEFKPDLYSEIVCSVRPTDL